MPPSSRPLHLYSSCTVTTALLLLLPAAPTITTTTTTTTTTPFPQIKILQRRVLDDPIPSHSTFIAHLIARRRHRRRLLRPSTCTDISSLRVPGVSSLPTRSLILRLDITASRSSSSHISTLPPPLLASASGSLGEIDSGRRAGPWPVTSDP